VDLRFGYTADQWLGMAISLIAVVILGWLRWRGFSHR